MHINATLLGRGAAASAVTASAAVLATRAQWSSDVFDEKRVMMFKTSFNTRKINRHDPTKPALAVTKGSCFDSFFPGVPLTRPEPKSKKTPVSTIIPRNFTLKGAKPSWGCRLMKFSGGRNASAFGYLSETTVQNEQFGLAFFVSVTNLKVKTTTELEYWLLFLGRNGGRWSLLGSHRFGGPFTGAFNHNGSVIHRQLNFSTKLPPNVPTKDRTWSWLTPVTPTADFDNFFHDDDTEKPSLWTDEDKYYSGLWFADEDKGDTPLFFGGSTERWALNYYLDPQAGTKDPQITLTKEVHLASKGAWMDLKEYCLSLVDKDRFQLRPAERRLCFSRWS